MVLWFVLPSIPCLMALAVRDDVVQPLLCVVCQLLRIGDVWAHVGIDVQEVVQVLFVSSPSSSGTRSQMSRAAVMV